MALLIANFKLDGLKALKVFEPNYFSCQQMICEDFTTIFFPSKMPSIISEAASQSNKPMPRG